MVGWLVGWSVGWLVGRSVGQIAYSLGVILVPQKIQHDYLADDLYHM
jgi:hypothetical protein